MEVQRFSSQFPHLRFAVERAELVDETYPGVKLRKTGDALFDSWHADEGPSRHCFVKDGSHLFELFMCNRSASSTRMSVVGSGDCSLSRPYSWKVWK